MIKSIEYYPSTYGLTKSLEFGVYSIDNYVNSIEDPFGEENYGKNIIVWKKDVLSPNKNDGVIFKERPSVLYLVSNVIDGDHTWELTLLDFVFSPPIFILF